MIEFDDYEGYKKPVVQKVNNNLDIATYTSIDSNNKDIVCIYNKIQDTNIVLYKDSIYNIYELLYKRKKIKNKRKKR